MPTQAERAEWVSAPVVLTDSELLIGSRQVMQSWERPIMERMAAAVACGDMLEVGFGMGISANAIMRHGCKSYTVIEAHPAIAANARCWGERQSVPVTVVEGFWQDIAPLVADRFDGILYDTFPVGDDYTDHGPAFVAMARLLRPGGRFTYYTGQPESVLVNDLKTLLNEFDSVEISRTKNLTPHNGCDYFHGQQMVVVVATKGTAS